MNYRYIIGIDPGVTTGIAVWNADLKKFDAVFSTSFSKAWGYVQDYGGNSNVFVRVEDARQRKWFGSSGREKLQGAGSIKRDCQLWEEFLTSEGIAHEFVAPKNNKTKLDSKAFQKITAWKERTSEHARDAAMLCFQVVKKIK